MKLVKLIRKISYKLWAILPLSMVSLSAFADDTSMSVSTLVGSVDTLSGSAAQIVAVVATVAGVILVVKGLVHLKQNYGGSSHQFQYQCRYSCIGLLSLVGLKTLA
jgi:type IV secretory pathway VirB2 component (pilin)